MKSRVGALLFDWLKCPEKEKLSTYGDMFNISIHIYCKLSNDVIYSN